MHVCAGFARPSSGAVNVLNKRWPSGKLSYLLSLGVNHSIKEENMYPEVT